MQKNKMQKMIQEDKNEILSFVVPSNTMREYLGQQKLNFSDAQLAALLFYQDQLDWGEKNDMIDRLKVLTDSKELKEHLDKYRETRRHAYHVFEAEQEDYIYVLEHRQKGYTRWWLDGFYNDFDSFKKLQERYRGCELRIRKQLVVYQEEDLPFQGEEDYLIMDDRFAILSFDSYILEYGKERLNDIFSEVLFPADHPFRKGDIAKNLLTGQYGIVMATEAEAEAGIPDENKKAVPFPELNLRFCALTDEGWSWNNKVSPYLLDKESLPEDASLTELLEEARNLLLDGKPNFGILQNFIEHTQMITFKENGGKKSYEN